MLPKPWRGAFRRENRAVWLDRKGAWGEITRGLKPQMTIETTEGSPSTLSLLFAEGLYTDYLRDPSSVPADWRAYFDSLGQGGDFARAPKLGPAFRPASVFNPPVNGAVAKMNGSGQAAPALNGKCNGNRAL